MVKVRVKASKNYFFVKFATFFASKLINTTFNLRDPNVLVLAFDLMNVSARQAQFMEPGFPLVEYFASKYRFLVL